MKFVVPGGAGNQNHIRAAVRCPHCGKEAVMEALGQHDFNIGNNIVCGQRRCPNPDCKGHLFIVFEGGNVLTAYPPVRLDFDPENVPAKVLSTFEEAITCHANSCYVAAAIMVRRTLEEVCADRNASGANLKAKIKDLESKIVVPAELLEAMDELRLLGNDAAHIEAKEYSAVSEVEVNVAIQFTKEILKALYQYTSLLNKLRKLKRNDA